MAVYTKTGDKGKTSTFSGKRISKSSKLIHAIGAIDELNSYLGVITSHYYNSNYSSERLKIVSIQNNLFTINAILTCAKLEFRPDATKELEKEIDEIEAKLPVQKNFLIYGGSEVSSMLYFARAICRRAERELSDLKIMNYELEIRQYINRLSDYLFIKAREENFKKKQKEDFWKP